ncbi:glycosyltransferase [Bradyrhizobium sp. 159]|uniref:glycosyltransferase n=1 Tax=Bradyrhizobium sp. 159 TaxID=2782632 RepID=UPI001FF774B7|nr:glycosyltransferase [Bradyrhizobium sp. 159]MCK1619034.1 glycosyltransferase [Bradyrhizobium sp. 159]
MSKLLLIAPTCDNQDVGEAWVAFQWTSRLAKRFEVTLLTYHKRDRTPVSKQLTGLRVIEWCEPMLVGRAERLNSMLKPGYLPFYFKARRWIRSALANGERFDLAYQPVPVAMRYPSPLVGLGIPYIVGPVGGSLESPEAFDGDDTAPWYIGLRNLDRLRLRRDPLLRATYEEASCVIGIAPYVSDILANNRLRRFEVMSETGIENLPEPINRFDRSGPVRLLYVGRMIRTKGARDAVRAMSLLRDLDIVLDVVGDGVDRAACEALASDLNVASRVVFHGRLPRQEVDKFYRAADIFVFPSYREPGGNVAFEAMGFGLPVIVSNRGGPGSAADETCGICLQPLSPEQYARDIAGAIRRLVEDRELRLALGRGGRRRVADIALWDRKIDHLAALFANVIGDMDGRLSTDNRPGAPAC